MTIDDVILAFHQTSARFSPGITNLSPGRFWAVLSLLESWGICLTEEPVECLPPAVITFDDGYEDNYPVLLALRERGIRPLVFIPTDYIESTNKWDYSSLLFPARHMNATQIRELADAGVIIGSHGASHRSFCALSPSQVAIECETSKKRLEDIIGRPVDRLSFPFGRFNSRVIETVRAAGFVAAYTMVQTPLCNPEERAFVFPRVAIHGIDDYFSLGFRLRLGSRWEQAKSRIISRMAGGTVALRPRLK